MRWLRCNTRAVLLTGAVFWMTCTSGCGNDAYRCSTVCAELADKGCVLSSDQGAGGATARTDTGCEASCEQSRTSMMAAEDYCSSEWETYADCLLNDTQIVCDGYWLDQVKGCDEERLAWDRCNGLVCDVRGGLNGTGETSEGIAYSIDYGWLDCDCETGEAEGELGSVQCGDTPCPKVCCCDGQVAAGACLDGQCASAEETCNLLQNPPFSICLTSSK